MKFRSPTKESLVLWAPGVILAFAVLIPVATLAVELTSGEDAITGVMTVLLSPDVWRLLTTSVALAAAVTTLATALGVPLGVLLGRTDVGGRGWLLAVHAFPIFVPPFLVALGWFHIVGANGYVGTPSTARLFFGPVGIVAVLGLTFAPIMTSLTALALQNVDPSLEDPREGGCGAGSRHRTDPAPHGVARRGARSASGLRSRSVRAGRAHVSAGADVPGERLRSAGRDRLRTQGSGGSHATAPGCDARSPSRSSGGFVGARTFAVLGLRRRKRTLFRLGRWKAPVTLACVCVTMLSLAPVLALAVRAGPDGLAEMPVWIRSSLWNSLRAAGLAATAITALGLTGAWAFARGRAGGLLLDATLMLGFLIPGAVLGLGLIAAWNHDLTRAVYGGTAILVFGLVARYAIVGVRVMATAVAQSARSL